MFERDEPSATDMSTRGRCEDEFCTGTGLLVAGSDKNKRLADSSPRFAADDMSCVRTEASGLVPSTLSDERSLVRAGMGGGAPKLGGGCRLCGGGVAGGWTASAL